VTPESTDVPTGQTFRVFLVQETGQEPPPPRPSAPVTQWLAAGLTFFTGTLTTIGTTTGGVERALRDYPVGGGVCLALVLLGVSFGIILPAVNRKVPDGWIALGAAVVLASTLAFAILIIHGKSDDQRPRTASSLSVAGRFATVKGNIKASGLQTPEEVVVRVEGRRRDDASLRLVPLYVSRLGPDPDGQIDAPIETVLRRRRYDRVFVSAEIVEEVKPEDVRKRKLRRCRATTENFGCTALVIPRPRKAGR
jgi:hypothetical protein